VAGRRLQIAAVTTAAESFVPGLMRAFADVHPDVELALVVGNRAAVLERVRAHRADVAFAGTPPEDERLRAEPILENAIACITAPDDPLADAPAVRAGGLSSRVWLLREEGSGTRAMGEQFLADRGLAPRILTVGSNGAIKEAAHAGLGISLLSRVAVAPELASGRLREITLSDGPQTRPWFMLLAAVGPRRAIVDQFVAFVGAHAASGGQRRSAR
jgi:DNA-binding transcriptional LysR family regulator